MSGAKQAKDFKVHPNQVTEWKRQLLEQASSMLHGPNLAWGCCMT